MIMALDFDGYLCEARFPEIGRPHSDVIEFFKRRRKAGDLLILWTCRTGKHLDEAVRWCESHGLKFDAINEDVQAIKDGEFGKMKSCKVYADVYWDDRNGTIELMEMMEDPLPKLKKKFVGETCGSCKLIDPGVEAEGIYYCPNPFCHGSGAAWFRRKLKSYAEDRDTHMVDLKELVPEAFQYTHHLPVTLRVKILALPTVKELVKKYMKGKLS